MINAWVKLETLETMVATLKRKNAPGIGIDISVNDEARSYGQNVTMTIAQTKEQREAKNKKFYVGNGRTFWSNNGEPTFTKQESEVNKDEPSVNYSAKEDDLPF